MMIKEHVLGQVLKNIPDNEVARRMSKNSNDEDQAVDGAGSIIAQLVDEHGGREFLAALNGVSEEEFTAGLAERRKVMEEAGDLSKFHKPFDTKYQ